MEKIYLCLPRENGIAMVLERSEILREIVRPCMNSFPDTIRTPGDSKCERRRLCLIRPRSKSTHSHQIRLRNGKMLLESLVANLSQEVEPQS